MMQVLKHHFQGYLFLSPYFSLSHSFFLFERIFFLLKPTNFFLASFFCFHTSSFSSLSFSLLFFSKKLLGRKREEKNVLFRIKMNDFQFIVSLTHQLHKKEREGKVSRQEREKKEGRFETRSYNFSSFIPF